MTKLLPKTYKRNQVEQAVWSLFSQTSGRDPIPRPFRTRIKRLLELDREQQAETGKNFAFFDAPPEGKGVEVAFTPFNAFCLTMGLDLLDIGFKQSEVVFCLQALRDKIEDTWQKIWTNPPGQTGNISVKDRPDKPSYINQTGHKRVDTRVFMMIRKIELREAWPLLKKERDLVIESDICFGLDQAYEQLATMGKDHRKVISLELSEIAVQVKKYLEDAPARNRGR